MGAAASRKTVTLSNKVDVQQRHCAECTEALDATGGANGKRSPTEQHQSTSSLQRSLITRPLGLSVDTTPSTIRRRSRSTSRSGDGGRRSQSYDLREKLRKTQWTSVANQLSRRDGLQGFDARYWSIDYGELDDAHRTTRLHVSDVIGTQLSPRVLTPVKCSSPRPSSVRSSKCTTPTRALHSHETSLVHCWHLHKQTAASFPL